MSFSDITTITDNEAVGVAFGHEFRFEVGEGGVYGYITGPQLTAEVVGGLFEANAFGHTATGRVSKMAGGMEFEGPQVSGHLVIGLRHIDIAIASSDGWEVSHNFRIP